MDVSGAHCERPWKLLEFKPQFCTHTHNNVLATYSSCAKGLCKMRAEVACNLETFVGFSLPCRSLPAARKTWLNNETKYLQASIRWKPQSYSQGISASFCLLFVYIYMHDVVFGRPSMTEKFQKACMNKYEQMFIRCSYHEWLAQFLCLLFKACCPFRADKTQNNLRI